MQNPFKKETAYIRLFENKVEVRYLGQTVTRTAHQNFSNERLLIAFVTVAETFIKQILNEIQGTKLLPPTLVVLLQPMEKIEGGIAEVERMVFQDLAMQIGGKYCFIHPTPEVLTNTEVRRITKT
jgi:hypothetical protein